MNPEHTDCHPQALTLECNSESNFFARPEGCGTHLPVRVFIVYIYVGMYRYMCYIIYLFFFLLCVRVRRQLLWSRLSLSAFYMSSKDEIQVSMFEQ